MTHPVWIKRLRHLPVYRLRSNLIKCWTSSVLSLVVLATLLSCNPLAGLTEELLTSIPRTNTIDDVIPLIATQAYLGPEREAPSYSISVSKDATTTPSRILITGLVNMVDTDPPREKWYITVSQANFFTDPFRMAISDPTSTDISDPMGTTAQEEIIDLRATNDFTSEVQTYKVVIRFGAGS